MGGGLWADWGWGWIEAAKEVVLVAVAPPISYPSSWPQAAFFAPLTGITWHIVGTGAIRPSGAVRTYPSKLPRKSPREQIFPYPEKTSGTATTQDAAHTLVEWLHWQGFG